MFISFGDNFIVIKQQYCVTTRIQMLRVNTEDTVLFPAEGPLSWYEQDKSSHAPS